MATQQTVSNWFFGLLFVGVIGWCLFLPRNKPDTPANVPLDAEPPSIAQERPAYATQSMSFQRRPRTYTMKAGLGLGKT